jgi:hypothetical protein
MKINWELVEYFRDEYWCGAGDPFVKKKYERDIKNRTNKFLRAYVEAISWNFNKLSDDEKTEDICLIALSANDWLLPNVINPTIQMILAALKLGISEFDCIQLDKLSIKDIRRILYLLYKKRKEQKEVLLNRKYGVFYGWAELHLKNIELCIIKCKKQISKERLK